MSASMRPVPARLWRFAISRDHISPTDLTTVAAAVLVVQLALDQEDEAASSTEEEEESSSEGSVSSGFGSDSGVTLHFTNSGGRTSPTGLATVVASALVLINTLGRLYEFGFCRSTVLCESKRPSFSNKLSNY